MTLYAVAIVEYGHRDVCSPKAKVLNVFDSEKDANDFVKEDIETWIDYYKSKGATANFKEMAAWLQNSPSERCEWSITKVKADI